MYRIINEQTGELIGLTESVRYIRIHEGNGCFVQCDEEQAIGVAFQSEPYNLFGHEEIADRPTIIVRKVDGGEVSMKQKEMSDKNAANIDYISMMADIDLPEEGEGEDAE